MLKSIGISLALFTSLTLISAVYFENISRSSLGIDAPVIKEDSLVLSNAMATQFVTAHEAEENSSNINMKKSVYKKEKDNAKTQPAYIQ